MSNKELMFWDNQNSIYIGTQKNFKECSVCKQLLPIHHFITFKGFSIFGKRTMTNICDKCRVQKRKKI